MLTKVIVADTIDGAVEKILEELKADAAGTASSSSSRRNVIYFDGWDGLGASAVLRAVGRRLIPEAGSSASATVGLEFSHIFHIDCSKWESRRAMQRLIAEELKLPASVMEMFDAQDEEDDYLGVAKVSRAEIPQVAEAINQHIQKLNRFLLIFHNGSSEAINLESLGFPLFDRYSRSKLLWSFQGRFRLYPRMKVDRALESTRMTDVLLSATKFPVFSDLAKVEAADFADENINSGVIDWPAAVANCFLYMMKLCRMGNDLIDYDLDIHGCSYWKCDGIIHLEQGDVDTVDGAERQWMSSEALQRELRLDLDYYKTPYLQSPAVRRLPAESIAYWTSPTYGFMLIQDPQGRIPKGMFQQFDKLCVLKLSACEFSFTSPPFLCCHNLRFLWLDRCREGGSTAEVVMEDIGRVLQRLWVLDVRYSIGVSLSQALMDFMNHLRELNVIGAGGRFDMDLLQRRLHNIRKLRVTNSDGHLLQKKESDGAIFLRMDKLELLEFSSNKSVDHLCVESCNSLETVTINGPTDLKVIRFRGCAKLKNLFLSGLFPNLKEITIDGAVVETLDLSAMIAPRFVELYLFECEKLCAILWPSSPEGKKNIYLSNLYIDTKHNEDNAINERGSDWHISVRDARLLRSLESVKDYFGPSDAHVKISTILSPTHPCADTAGNKDAGMKSSSGQHVQLETPNTVMYADVGTLKDSSTQQQQAAKQGDCDNPAIMCTCPPPPEVSSQGCYIHIEDPVGRTTSQTVSITLPGFICDGATVLHVHDSLHVTGILAAPIASATWNKLEWCRVERCPNLGCVFSPQLGGPEGSHTAMFKKLRTTWVSHLPKARYIWKWSGSSVYWLHGGTFGDLTLLHLDCCPRVEHVIHYPLIEEKDLARLETLEIMWCSDLSVAFHFYDTPGMPASDIGGWGFPKLKHVYLHELPKLLNIGNIGVTISMPELETIKVRGCWSLRRLPIVKESTNVVECDCEKEWWDGLEWESEQHKSLYKPIHPRHHKKTVLKGSVLR